MRRTPESYKPTVAEKASAIRGGMKYVAGAGMLHDPEDAFRFHHLNPDSYDDASHIVERAKRLIYDGIDQVIRYANNPRVRSSREKMRTLYEAALPNIMETQINLYTGSQVKRFFPLIAALTPMPVLDPGIYKRFCHGSFGSEKLTLLQMMDGVSVDERLEDHIRPSGAKPATVIPAPFEV